MKRIYNYIIALITVIIIVGLGIGYSTFSARLQVEDTEAYVRRQENYRITGFSLDSVYSDAEVVNNYMEFSERSLISNIKLPNSNSYVKFKVYATNLGNTYVAIHNFTNLNSDLQIDLTDYNYDDKICNGNNCTLNATKDFYITIKYKNGVTPTNNAYNINLGVNFVNIYTITYTGNGTNLLTNNPPSEVIAGSNLTLNFSSTPTSVTVNNVSQTVTNNSLTISNVNTNLTINITVQAVPSYTITYTGTGTSLLINAPTSVTQGGNLTLNFSATPMSVAVNSVAQTVTNNSLTISNVQSNLTINIIAYPSGITGGSGIQSDPYISTATTYDSDPTNALVGDTMNQITIYLQLFKTMEMEPTVDFQ